MDSIILKESMKSKGDYFSTRMVQCLEQLFFARPGSNKIEMFKVDQVRSGKPNIAKMSSLRRSVIHFSITAFKNKRIFLTGGWANGGKTKLCSSYSIESNEWKTEPELKNARSSHSSCSLGERFFVFGGEGEGSVESL